MGQVFEVLLDPRSDKLSLNRCRWVAPLSGGLESAALEASRGFLRFCQSMGHQFQHHLCQDKSEIY